MDAESQKRLDEITAKEPEALTEPEIEYLRARSSYLSADQRVTYAAVLGGEQPEKPAKASKSAKTEE